VSPTDSGCRAADGLRSFIDDSIALRQLLNAATDDVRRTRGMLRLGIAHPVGCMPVVCNAACCV
jgi:hypothetical protein